MFRLRGWMAAAALALAACAGGATETVQTTLTIEAVDLGFRPTTLEVTAAQPARLVRQNNGLRERDFTVAEFPLEGAAEATGGSDHEAGHAAGETPDLHVAALGGQSATLEFTPTKPGTYEFWCTVPGHKEAGMSGTLVVLAPEAYGE